MIEVPTTLVLGAGASMDFGFPSGQRLLLDVVSALASPTSGLSQVLGQIGIEQSVTAEFREALILSRPPSVDVLLETREEFLKVGKASIAASLIPHEAGS